MFEIVGENLTLRLRRVIFTCMLRQEIGWFDQPENKIGILTSRLAVDATIVRGVRPTRLLLVKIVVVVEIVLALSLTSSSLIVY